MLPASFKEGLVSPRQKHGVRHRSLRVSGIRSAEDAGLLSGRRVGTRVASGILSLYVSRALSGLTCLLVWQTCPYHGQMLS